MEIAFLASPAAGYCPLSGGVLDFCIFPPSGIATFVVWVGLALTATGVASCVFAWRGRLGKAVAFSLPGVILVVLGLLLLIGHATEPTAPINPPPSEYRFFEIGVSASLVGLISLAAASCAQFWYRAAAPTSRT